MATREQQRIWEKAYYERHKEEIRARKAEQMRVRRMKFPDKFRQQKLTYQQATRERLFGMYGSVCALCKFEDKRALTLDHINGDGNMERREYGERGVYRNALMDYRPDKYRILCMNCQFIAHKERSKRQQHGDCLEANE